jgi:hypothetical protein
MCIDRNTGKTIWQKTAAELLPHEGHHQTGSFAAGSPVTDGKISTCPSARTASFATTSTAI